MERTIRTATVLLWLGILLAAIQHGEAERKIVCYYTNWSVYRPGTAKFSPQNINPYLCTHLIYAFGGFTKDNALKPFDKYQDIEKGGYAKFTGLKTYNKKLKTMLAIGGWNEGSSRFSPMVADPGRRREFVKNSIKFLRQNHFDGLDLDWEYPAFRDGGKPRDRDNYANLVQELYEEFERESSKTGRTRLLLSMAVPAGIEYIDKGYDVPRLNRYLDFVNLLSYDYHSAYEPAVNHHAPLYPLEEDNEYNYDTELTIDYTIEHLLKKGASPEKIILGIPTYGRSYTLFNEEATDLGSPADGPGIEGDATREKGYLAYYEICENLDDSEEWEIARPNSKAMGPYAFKGDQWVGYDDEDIVRLKAKYANERELGGIMFWSIDNDDFRGKCHDRPYPLIEAAKESLLAGESRSSGQKSKSADARKKSRPRGGQRANAIGRKLGSNGRRSTTPAKVSSTEATYSKKRLSSRPKYRAISRPRITEEEEEEEEEENEKEIDERSYDSVSSETEEEGDSDKRNAVRTTGKRTGSKGKARGKGGSGSERARGKPNRRKGENRSASSEESPSNKLTTPEPPTTPDPGTDFKCEDEGFFPHPRDCKKYFWCLDAGPGGLGVVAHQFTCPSGLVFNKAADSCDYPRNVVCPKSKADTAASTTRAPITAATSRTTFLYSTTLRTSTAKPESEEYEYYEDDDDDDDDGEVANEDVEEEEEEEEEEKKEAPKARTSPKPLLYKTIERGRPSTTTVAPTSAASSTAANSERIHREKTVDLEDEEDPKVIKELIELIKKAGGIEHLEKQLRLQGRTSDEAAPEGERVTPATISRTLYERVLSRQANKIASERRASPDNGGHANGPGGAQFEGLDDVPEVKSLRRAQKPQYVTLERPRSSTKKPPAEDDEAEEEEEEEEEEDNENVASSEDRAVGNLFSSSSTARSVPNYVNIRRSRPSTTTSRNENDVEEKDEAVEDRTPIRRRRPVLSKNSEAERSEESAEEPQVRPADSEKNAPTTKSRYVSVQRFRGTTARSSSSARAETTPVSSASEEPTTESLSSSTTETTEEPVTTVSSTSTTPTTPTRNSTEATLDVLPPSTYPVESTVEATSTTESVKLVEDSATEILLTTVSVGRTISSSSQRVPVATVSQPRPFGFAKRNRPLSPSTEATTTPLPPSPSDRTRSKVAPSETIERLPTLKELIGYRIDPPTDLSSSPVHLDLLSSSYVANFALRSPYDRPSALLERENETNSVFGESPDENFAFEESDANDVEDSSDGDGEELYRGNGRKIRIDRDDTTPPPSPTTMRGMPLTDFLVDHSPRGFYVTKSSTDSSTTNVLGRTENVDPLTTEFHVTTSRTAERIATIAGNMDGEANGESVGRSTSEETTTNVEQEESDSSTSATFFDLETEREGATFIATTASTTLETEYADDASSGDSKTSTSTVTQVDITASSRASTSKIDPVDATTSLGASAATTVSSSESSATAPSASAFSTIPPRVPDTFFSSTRPLPIAATRSVAPFNVSSKTISSITPTNSKSPPTSSSSARTTSVTSEIPTSNYVTSTSTTMESNITDDSAIIDAEKTDATPTPAMSTDTNVIDDTNVTASDDSATAGANFPSIRDKTIHRTKTTVQMAGSGENDAQLKGNDSIVEASRSTLPSTSVESSTTSVAAESNARRRQRIRVNASNHEFGRKKPGRMSLDGRVADKRPTEENPASLDGLPPRPRQYPRRRITVYRGRHRAANATRTRSNASTIPDDAPIPRNSRDPPRMRVVLKRVKSKSAEARTSTRNEEKRKIGNESVVEDGPLRDSIPSEENTDRTVAEVNSPKNSEQPSRAVGSLPTSRFRKTNSSSSTARKNRPAGVTSTATITENLASKEGTTETPEKDIDQSSRAQELAVTLADPPPPQSTTGTGRLPLRDALRRKISTTVVPRTEPTTSRTTLRFTSVPRNRQRPKPKDKLPEKVPTRPRRPPVIDYDYYEDEEEAVVRKTTLNEKLFLTSKGTVRCLDQGNFPHPYSCKKFITCARMVNGQVTGAEYTCPDKLSFDPVGGICNWSAGLGCKE